MLFMLRTLWRTFRTFRGHLSDDMVERLLDTADSFGADTSGVRKLLEVMIGEKVRDLGIIEQRTYGRLDITYHAWLNRVEDEDRIVLIVKDQALRPTFWDFSKDKQEYRIPIRQGAARTLLSILEQDEERFMQTAAHCESLLETKRMIEKDSIANARDTLLRWFAFLPLKECAEIDQISHRVPRESGREIQYDLGIGVYIGKEHDEVLLVLRFEMRYRERGVPGRLHHILYYPFGATGRENLRRALRETNA
ncbi:MAG: hypothetical protein HQ583_06955 [Candidatus Abyssubacteria bacterium]|nr:hypothetical protein [Candidatus Abyssubacteria bacterium]